MHQFNFFAVTVWSNSFSLKEVEVCESSSWSRAPYSWISWSFCNLNTQFRYIRAVLADVKVNPCLRRSDLIMLGTKVSKGDAIRRQTASRSGVGSGFWALPWRIPLQGLKLFKCWSLVILEDCSWRLRAAAAEGWGLQLKGEGCSRWRCAASSDRQRHIVTMFYNYKR